MKTTVKDVAKEVGCSLSLVYYYLNHPGTTRVAAETRKKIDQAIRKLDYHPNMAASILKNGSARVIGVMIDTEAPDVIKRLLAALEREITSRNFYLQAGMFHYNLNSFCSSYTLLQQFGAKGVICLSHDYPAFNEQIESFFKDKSDIVFYDVPERKNLSHLNVDYESGFSALWNHLKEQGRNRLALCLSSGSQVWTANVCRISAYRNVVQKDTLPLCLPDFSKTRREIFEQTLIPYIRKEKPQAILFQNDRIALSAMQFLLSRGMRIPEDLSVIGFDDDEQSRESTPALSTIAVDMQAAAKQLTDLLFEQLEHRAQPHSLLLPARLILRSSCC